MKTGAPTGERHGMAKLTDAKVLEMRRRYADGDVSILNLAVEYDIAYSTCREALHGQTWGHIGGPLAKPLCSACHGSGRAPANGE